MTIGKDKHSLLIENMMDGFAYHQVERDNSGTPVNYIILDLNPAFKEITGLGRSDVLGKSVTEVMSGAKKNDFDWIGAYAD